MFQKITSLLIIVFINFNTMAQTKYEKQVAEAVENLRTAMITPDSTKLSMLVSAKLSYGHSGGFIENKAGFIQTLLSGKSDFVTIDLTEQHITVFGKSAAVRHIFNADTNDGGKPGHVKLSILSIWYKEKSNWKLIARQAVKVQ